MDNPHIPCSNKLDLFLGLDLLIHKSNGWEVTERRFRIDSTEFRRKLSQETLKSQFVMNFGFLGKSLEDRTPPKLSLEAPAASKLILGGLRFLPNKMHHKLS